MSERWTPEPVWRGETCFILAGGPSLAGVDLRCLRGRRTITINSSMGSAIAAGLDDGVLFFTDTDWFEARAATIAKWRGLVVTAAGGLRRSIPHTVRQVRAELRRDFPPPGSPSIRGGRSSGHKAIGFAVALGAVRIVLLGYDMRAVNGRTHHHDEYWQADPSVYGISFIPAFRGWREDAERIGVEILNATPGSALTEFPTVDLDDEVLRGAEC